MSLSLTLYRLIDETRKLVDMFPNGLDDYVDVSQDSVLPNSKDATSPPNVPDEAPSRVEVDSEEPMDISFNSSDCYVDPSQDSVLSGSMDTSPPSSVSGELPKRVDSQDSELESSPSVLVASGEPSSVKEA